MIPDRIVHEVEKAYGVKNTTLGATVFALSPLKVFGNRNNVIVVTQIPFATC